MIFKSEPEMYLVISTLNIRRRLQCKGVQFDKNGFYETENEALIALMIQRFEVVTPKIEVTEEATVVLNSDGVVRHCKKCDFKCNNQGELLVHYRTEHPKNKGVK